ncbi:transporter substrate-binding domain-containing protein [Thalassolituus sp. LLYu03]|uniref:transporter substrate-binding domain-containing protein n=1 Tax=Thalassolituus sp. LLYu03 TaxID=3421656 RepID=UPI003D2B0AB9
MPWTDDYERAGWRTRQLTVLLVVVFTLLTALLSVSLHYYFSRSEALEAATTRYQLTAASTRNYLAGLDNKGLETVKVLSRFPSLVVPGKEHGVWVDTETTLPLFAEVMRTTPVFYAVYIGFETGDLWELVNLNSSDIARRQLNATPADRWVIIKVEGKGDQRRRVFEYLAADYSVNFSRSEPSDYDVRQRLWYTSAVDNEVVKTPPYLFQHLQSPGQSFVLKLPGTGHVLAVDMTFSTLSSHLKGQALSAEGSMFLYKANGELLATNLTSSSDDLPPVGRLSLPEEDRIYLHSLGAVRASNENDWTPVDFAIGGEPQGLSVDVLKLLARMTGLSLEFVNGYRWPELMDLYHRGELEILQPLLATNNAPGRRSRPMFELPYAVMTRDNEPALATFADLAGRTVVIPEGWSYMPVLQKAFPQVTFNTVANNRDAFMAIVQGKADATVDTALILEQGISQYYLKGVRLHRQLPDLAFLPTTFHLSVRSGYERLGEILDQALAALPPGVIEKLHKKWGNPAQTKLSDRLPVVPYEHLQKLPQQPGELNLVTRIDLNGEPYFSFASVFTREQSPAEYFALLIPAERVYGKALHDVWVSALIIAILWLLLVPPVLIWLVIKPVKFMARVRG